MSEAEAVVESSDESSEDEAIESESEIEESKSDEEETKEETQSEEVADEAETETSGEESPAVEEPAGASSSTHGFIAAGGSNSPSGPQNVVDKFAFASSGNAVDHGDITVARYYAVGAFSATYGYVCGGEIVGAVDQDVIDK